MIHSLEPTLSNLHGHYSRNLKPILTISSGDTICCKTLDAGWGEIHQPNPFSKPIKLAGRDCERAPGHALVGPVAIEGAKKGMTLEVRFKTIRTAKWGWSAAGGWKNDINNRLRLDNGSEWILRWVLDSANCSCKKARCPSRTRSMSRPSTYRAG